MPIRPENRDRYPPNWREISAAVREEAGQKCEWCSIPNGVMVRRGVTHDGRHVWRESSATVYENGRYDDGTEAPDSGEDTCDYRPAVRVVLTVAHLGLPAHLPLLLHVAGDAMADEIIDLVGLLMPLDAEAPKWHAMMHNRATAKFLTGSTTYRTRFLVPIPSDPARRTPTRSIVFGPEPATPVWIGISSLSLLRKPHEAAFVPTEPASLPMPVSAGLEGVAASFANEVSQPAFGGAYMFSATGKRTSHSAVRDLLRCDWEYHPAYWADETGRGFPRACHTNLYHFDEYPENCFSHNLKALCQRCHNRYDAKTRAAGIAERAREKAACRDMFGKETPT